MKKFYMTAVALMLAVCIYAQDEVATEIGTISYYYIRAIPKSFTYGHKLIVFSEPRQLTPSFSLYDSNFTFIKTITLPSEEMKTGSVIQERKEVEYEDGEGHHYTSYTGEWITDDQTSNRAISYNTNSTYLYYTDLDDSNSPSADVNITQTLFNDDSAFEYIKLNVQPREEVDERDRDGDGEIDYIRTSYTYSVGGRDVYTEDGTKILSLPFIQYLYKMNNQFYGITQAGIVYLINPTTSSVKRMENVQLAIRPNVVDRGSIVTVELDDTDTARELVVTGMDGRIVERRDIPAGERQIQVPAARMASGMYNFTIRKRGTVEKNGKVIVK